MSKVSKAKLAQFKKWVEEDWPNDPMLQEIHLIRLIRQAEMKGMTDEQIVAYYRDLKEPQTKSTAA